MRCALKRLCAALITLVSIVVSLAGCASGVNTRSATTTVTTTRTPSIGAGVTPTPVWFPSASEYWSGYSVPQCCVTGLRAQWNQPAVTGQPDSDVYVWIGVGGWGATNNELVQIGTLAYIYPDGASENNDVWYETLPQSTTLTSLYVAPGDEMSADMELAPGSTQNWTLTITDLTTRQPFSVQLVYPSSQVYADFVVEDPRRSTAPDAATYPLAHFSAVTFTHAAVRYGQRWESLASLQSMQVTLRQSGKTLATPGDLKNDGSFTVTYSAGQSPA